MLRVAITGATGFIGRNLLQRLQHTEVVVIGRTIPGGLNYNSFFNLSIGPDTDYSSALNGVDIIVHCAARAHIMNDEAVQPLEEYRATNTAGTIELARQAASKGVKRFIFISSVKVNGEQTQPDDAFLPTINQAPKDYYGLSKFEAEEGLKQLAENSRMEFVIIRPPLVYGPGVKANFSSLMNLVSKGFPLPFGAINTNRRSLVSVKNLIDLIVTCIDHPKAANRVFLVSDDNDLSTAEMVRHMARGLGVRSRMLPVPSYFFSLVGKLLRKQDAINRLTGNLQVDISHTKERLDWKPPQSVEEAFRETALEFLTR